jgi:hypothetical protein
LNFCHADPFPDLLEYISALATLPNRGKVSQALRPAQPAPLRPAGKGFSNGREGYGAG